MYIDVHCHIETYSDINEVIERAKIAGVGIIINNSVDLKSMKKTLSLTEWYPEVKAAFGIDPIEGLKVDEPEFNEGIEYIRKNKDKIIAMGEIGIDLRWSSELETQKRNFLKLVKLSKELNIPIIIHSRKAEKEVIEILENEKCNKVIMHCFTGGLTLVDRIIKNGWSISIPTNVVFNSQIQDIVKKAPMTSLLCETDSPYFHPLREKRNEPCFVIENYKKIAEIKNMELVEVEEAIEENYHKVFGKS